MTRSEQALLIVLEVKRQRGHRPTTLAERMAAQRALVQWLIEGWHEDPIDALCMVGQRYGARFPN